MWGRFQQLGDKQFYLAASSILFAVYMILYFIFYFSPNGRQFCSYLEVNKFYIYSEKYGGFIKTLILNHGGEQAPCRFIANAISFWLVLILSSLFTLFRRKQMQERILEYKINISYPVGSIVFFIVIVSTVVYPIYFTGRKSVYEHSELSFLYFYFAAVFSGALLTSVAFWIEQKIRIRRTEAAIVRRKS